MDPERRSRTLVVGALKKAGHVDIFMNHNLAGFPARELCASGAKERTQSRVNARMAHWQNKGTVPSSGQSPP